MKRATDLVAEAKSRIENLDVAGVDKEQADGVFLVDLREPAELTGAGRCPDLHFLAIERAPRAQGR